MTSENYKPKKFNLYKENWNKSKIIAVQKYQI